MPWQVYLICIEIVIIIVSVTVSDIPLTPKQLYNISKMNWFGCWVCSILLCILFHPISIIRFMYFIFHVGRK